LQKDPIVENFRRAVERQVKDLLAPFYKKRKIDKVEYKYIMRKTVPKIWKKGGKLNSTKIQTFIEAYVKKVIAMKRRKLSHPLVKGALTFLVDNITVHNIENGGEEEPKEKEEIFVPEKLKENLNAQLSIVEKTKNGFAHMFAVLVLQMLTVHFSVPFSHAAGMAEYLEVSTHTQEIMRDAELLGSHAAHQYILQLDVAEVRSEIDNVSLLQVMNDVEVETFKLSRTL
uniref:Polyprotein n=1 Tax=Soboliphyme baturini TaxID=241478 RepID=A0A183IP70_9BILA